MLNFENVDLAPESMPSPLPREARQPAAPAALRRVRVEGEVEAVAEGSDKGAVIQEIGRAHV